MLGRFVAKQTLAVLKKPVMLRTVKNPKTASPPTGPPTGDFSARQINGIFINDMKTTDL